VANAGRPSTSASPFRWQRSSAARRLIQGGCHTGAKLWPSLGSARQGEQGVDEHHPAVGADREVVDVEVAGGPGELRHVEPVVALVRLAGLERVVEAPELVEGREVELAAVRGQAHGAVEAALEQGQPSVRLQAEQEQLAGLVGGAGESDVLLGQPGGELARGQQLERRRSGRSRRRLSQRGSRR